MFLKRFFATVLFSFTFLYSFSQDEIQYITINHLDSAYKSHQKSLSAIQNYEIDRLGINDCELNDIETQLNYLEYYGLEHFFDFKNFSQIELYQKYKNLIAEVKQIRTVLDQQIANIDFWYYKTAKDFLSKSDTLNALLFLNKSLQYNYLYIFSVNLKSNLLILQNKSLDATSDLLKISGLIYSDNDNYKLLYTTVLQLNNALSEKFKIYYNTGYYNESMLYSEYADSLCNAFNFYNCSEYKAGIINSKTGIYKSFLRIANQAVATNNYNIAESYTDKAQEYAVANRDAISNDYETNKNYKFFVGKYLSFSNKYKTNGNIKFADKYYQKAKRICELLKISDCEKISYETAENIILPDSVITETLSRESVATQIVKNERKTELKKTNKNKTKIHNKKSKINKKNQQNLKSVQNSIAYDLIEIGNELYSKSKYEEAYKKFTAAKTLLAAERNIDKSKIDILINQTAEQILSLPFKGIDFILWSEDFEKVDSLIDLCKDMQKTYNQTDNAFINAELNRISVEKNSKLCKKKEEDLSLLTQKAFSLFDIKEFRKVQLIVDEVVAMKSKSEKCNLNYTDFNKISNLIKPVTSYFNLRNMAKQYFDERKFSDFSDFYLSADSVYKNYRLDSLKIAENNIISFLKYQNNDTINLQIAEILLLTERQNECLLLLNVLRENNYSAVNTKKIQENLVKLVAANRQLDLVYLNIKYPFLKDEKWFRYFIKQFNLQKKK